MAMHDRAPWPPAGTLCTITPCGATAVCPGPLCWPHFSIIPRPHKLAIKRALAFGSDDAITDVLAAAVARVQETVNRMQAAIAAVETRRY